MRMVAMISVAFTSFRSRVMVSRPGSIQNPTLATDRTDPPEQLGSERNLALTLTSPCGYKTATTLGNL
jgi:hypothetical protein